MELIYDVYLNCMYLMSINDNVIPRIGDHVSVIGYYTGTIDKIYKITTNGQECFEYNVIPQKLKLPYYDSMNKPNYCFKEWNKSTLWKAIRLEKFPSRRQTRKESNKYWKTLSLYCKERAEILEFYLEKEIHH